MIRVVPFKALGTLSEAVEALLRDVLSLPGALMLSGGSTPYAIYNRLAATPCPVHPERHLFLSDERMVPNDSPLSNTGNLRPMLNALKCYDQFIPIDTSLPAAEAATRFGQALESLESIDLGLLGIGQDGHTAGLFTAEQARQPAGTYALYADRPDGLQGVTHYRFRSNTK